MSLERVTAIAGRIFTQFRRDHRTIALILVVPIVVMSLIGYLLSDRRQPVTVGFVNADQASDTPVGRLSLGTEFEAELRRQATIVLRPYVSVEAAEAALRSGEILGVVEVPEDLTERVLTRRPASLRVAVRGIDPMTDGTVRGTVGRAMLLLAERVAAATGAGGPGMAVTVDNVSLLAGPGLSTIDYYGPSFIVAFAFFFTFLLTSVSFLRERSTGTIERLAVSPATRLEVVVGYLLGFLVFALLQSLVIMGYGVWALDMRVTGSIGLALLVLAVLVVGVVNLGIALSFFARNELQVVQFIPLVFVPQLLLAGLIWPVETFHPLLRTLAQVLPLTHALAALRTVMIAGGGLADIQGRLLVLLAFAAAMIALGAGALQKQKA